MATITLKGNEIHTLGQLPETGSKAPDFQMTRTDLSPASLSEFMGKKVVLNIFPSIDTGTCAQSVRKFNEEATELEDTVVLCISKDLPFAQARFCGAEGVENVEMLSDFKDGSFGKTYQLEFSDGPLQSLHSRAVIILNKKQEIVYTEQVPEIVDEPDYGAALQALADA